MKLGLVVEDLPTTADWLGQLLRDTFPGMEARLVSSLREARSAIAQQRPDLALVDLGLPDGNGVDLIREISQLHPGCQCIVTTIYADDRHLFPALRAGATGYLLKDQPKERLMQQLRGIAAGEPPLSPSIAQRLLRAFDDPERRDEEQEKLSPRETETLTLIAKGYKLPEVAEAMGVTRNTAAGFIKNVYRKLKVSSRAEATLEAARRGLVNTRL